MSRKKKVIILVICVIIIACVVVAAVSAKKTLSSQAPDSATTSSSAASISASSDSQSKDQTAEIPSDDASVEAGASTSRAAQNQNVEKQPATQQQVTGGHIVVLDPGHQVRGDSRKEPNGPGSSTMKACVTGGTHGTVTGVYEYQLALNISQKLKRELENRGYTVYMTRESNDVDISNKERAQYAAAVGGEIAVRIHANGSESSSAHGALTLVPSDANRYVSSLASASQKLGKCILDDYCTATGMRNLGVQKNDTMTGMNWSTVPVTILELGFMTNPTDDRNMEDEAYQDKMVQGIANGIDKYFSTS